MNNWISLIRLKLIKTLPSSASISVIGDTNVVRHIIPTINKFKEETIVSKYMLAGVSLINHYWS